MEQVVTNEVAEAEVLKWLEFKKVSKSKRFAEDRVNYSDDVNRMIEAVEDGVISIDCAGENPSFEIKHKLSFPIEFDEGGDALSELTYKPRLKTFELTKHLKGVKPSDADGRILAHKAALTNVAKGLINKLDTTTDSGVANAIVLFFI